jgi:acyl-CoA hydrolase
MGRVAASASLDFRSVLNEGDAIAWPQGTGEPLGLTGRLMAQANELPLTTLVLGMVTSATLDHAGAGKFRFRCLNGAGATRKAVAMSGNRVLPVHLSSIPLLIRDGRIRVDVVLLRVRPTADERFYSLGVVVDFVHEMIDAARLVIAEIDERMPLTSGDTLVPQEKITHFASACTEEALIVDPSPSDTELEVARRVAALIPDRATVQFGIGTLPVAVSQALRSHKDLGLHSGVIPDAAVDLIKSGVITNRFKGVDDGASVTGGLFGTRKLMDFAHENDAISMRRVDYTHSAATFAKIRAFHTVNAGIAIDLSGQVNAETVGGRYIGAVGGYVDFVRGGRLSPGGRSIIAITSTTPDSRHSKIVASLGKSAVTAARSDIDLVVTEHGVADLWGMDLTERAKALIDIAHPKFRDELSRQVADSFKH